jgi:hypothetical protein
MISLGYFENGFMLACALPIITINSSQDKGLSDRPSSNAETGCNVTAEQLSILERVQGAAMQEAIANYQRICMEQQEQRHREWMQRYLESGDPILMAEAIAWMHISGNNLTES